MEYQTLPAPGDLLNEKSAAAVLAVAVTTMRNWRALRTGPRYVKVGKRSVRYRRADLEAFIMAGMAKEGA
ncbi:helix-turn-helix transcriptional regulator [Xanthomonas albilineans]|uniref:helix-turn-helix transcriptional regulator n=1 Tax=Xanthomonas albilineans TaxID=29447 RepID=UPI0005F33CCB|nr:helix-turn-helix domain-containing protein [Xanthomonas albilineans]